MIESESTTLKIRARRLARLFHKTNPILSAVFEEEFIRGKYKFKVKITKEFAKAQQGEQDDSQ